MDNLSNAQRGAALSRTKRCKGPPGCSVVESLELRRLLSSSTILHTVASFPAGVGPEVATSVGDLAIFADFQQVYPTAHATNEVAIYDARTGRWHQSVLSLARNDISATSVDGLAIFAGGVDSQGNPLGIVDIYNAATNLWSTTTLPQPAWNMSVTTVGNLALFAGGDTTSSLNSPTDLVQIYNAANGQWTTATLSQARAGIAATTVGNLAFFAGGGNGSSSPISTVDIYNNSTGQWSTTQLPAGQSVGTVAVSADGLAIFSQQAGLQTKTIDIFNPNNGQWTTADQGPRTDINYAATQVGDQALVARGFDFSEDPLNDMDFYTQALPANQLALTGTIATPHKGIVRVRLVNGGSDALETPFYVDVYASLGRTFGSSAVLLGSVRMQTLLNTGGSLSFNVPITVQKNLPSGDYHLIATVYSGGEQAQFASTRQTVALVGSTATPALVRPIFSTIASTGLSPMDAWLADTADVLA